MLALFSRLGYNWSEPRETGWTLPTEEECRSLRIPEAHYTSTVMDIFGKLFQDSCLRSEWEALKPSDETGPPLFLSAELRESLRIYYDENTLPSAIIRNSEMFLSSVSIMQQVAPEDKNFCRRPLFFLFCLELHQPVSPAHDTTILEETYWVTIKLSPEEQSLGVFVRPQDQAPFLSTAESNIALINLEAATISDYWGYERHSYSISDLEFINDSIAQTDSASGPVNATFLFFTFFRAMPQQVRKFLTIEPREVLDDLQGGLLSVCGNQTSIGRIKRKRDDIDEGEERLTKRSLLESIGSPRPIDS